MTNSRLPGFGVRSILGLTCLLATVACGAATTGSMENATPSSEAAQGDGLEIHGARDGAGTPDPFDESRQPPEGFLWYRSVAGVEMAVPDTWHSANMLVEHPAPVSSIDAADADTSRQSLRSALLAEARSEYISIGGDGSTLAVRFTGAPVSNLDQLFSYALRGLSPRRARPDEAALAGAETRAAIVHHSVGARRSHVWVIRAPQLAAEINCTGPATEDAPCARIWPILKRTIRLLGEDERRRFEAAIIEAPPRDLGGAVWMGHARKPYDPDETEMVVLSRGNAERMELHSYGGPVPDCILPIAEPIGTVTCEDRPGQQVTFESDGDALILTQIGEWGRANGRQTRLTPVSPMHAAIGIEERDYGNSSPETAHISRLVDAAESAAREVSPPPLDRESIERAILEAGVQPQTVWLHAARRIVRQLEEGSLVGLRHGPAFVGQWRREVVLGGLNRLPARAGGGGDRDPH